MSNLTKAACELSIQLLFRGEKNCYLWTFTFPDDVSPEDAAKRWRLLVRWLIDTKRKCVRVLESGTFGERWHYHCVTPEWWDVNEIRAAAESRGFGRINAKVIPAERASYVAKYLNKQNRTKLPPGQRRWSCVGFDGVPVNRVEASRKTRYVPKDQVGKPYTAVEWIVGTEVVRRVELRVAVTPANEDIQRIHLTPAQVQEIVAAAEKGPILLGEYRGLRVTTKTFEDPKSEVKIEQVFIEHSVDGGNNARSITEWLPKGADETSVTTPAELGAVVLVHFRSIRVVGGLTYFNGTVAPLAGNLLPGVVDSLPLSPPVA